jgi:cytochrome c-type biogenesis protein CcmH
MISNEYALWFLAGLFTAVALTALIWPWIAEAVHWAARPARKWVAIGVLMVAVTACLWGAWQPGVDRSASAPADIAIPTASSAAGASGHGGDSLQAALMKLEARLRSGSGTAADWGLLAQTYAYLGRASDAENARSHHVVAAAPAADAPNALWPAALVDAVESSQLGRGLETAVTTTSPVAGPPASASTRRQALRLLSVADKALAAHNYPAAQTAYERVAALGQMSAQSWADFADVAASLNGEHLEGVPQQYIEAALRLDPDNQKALWLQASAQHETHRYGQAVVTWTRLLAMMPAGSAQARIFTANLAEDQRLVAESPQPAAASGDTASAPAGLTQVSGQVTLDGTLGSKVPAGLTLFIVARSLSSPGAPVAVVRTRTGTWPVSFHLDDSLAMLPGRKLSAAGTIAVEARISQSGTASSAPGDFASRAVTVDARSEQALHLVIDHVVR